MVGIEKVPATWTLNPAWESTKARMQRLQVDDEADPSVGSFALEDPSKWVPVFDREEENAKPILVDYWFVRKA